MSIVAIITGLFTGLIAVLCGVYISFTARKKGPVFSNAYIWSSKEDRKKVDRNAEYKLVTIVFGCLSAIFGLLTVHIFTSWTWAYTLMWVLIAFVMIYVIVDAVKKNVR